MKNKLKKTTKTGVKKAKSAEAATFWRHPTWGHVYGVPVAGPTGRLAWAHVATPKPERVDKGQVFASRYEFECVYDPEADTSQAFEAAVRAMVFDQGMLELYNQASKAKLGEVDLFAEGNTRDLERNPHYEDQHVIQGRSPATTPIPVYDLDGNKLDPSVLHNGMIVKSVLVPKITSSGVSYDAKALVLVEDDGVRFSGGAPSAASLLSLLGVKAKPESEEVESEEDEAEEEEAEETEEEADESEDEAEEDEAEEEEEDAEEDESEEDEAEEEEEDEDDDLPESYKKPFPKAANTAPVKTKAAQPVAAPSAKKPLKKKSDLGLSKIDRL